MIKYHPKKIFQKRSLSQVFLKENWPCENIVAILKKHEVDEVLEIGPGGGILTKELIRHKEACLLNWEYQLV